MCISDPGTFAPQTRQTLDTLRELVDGMLLAAALRNDTNSAMLLYATLFEAALDMDTTGSGSVSADPLSSAEHFDQIVNLFRLDFDR